MTESPDFELSAEAARRLREALGADDAEFVVTGTGRAGRLGRVTAVSARVAGSTNKVARIVVAEDGSVHEPAEVAAMAGRDVFAPVFTHGPGPERLPREPVTIDPRSNDWTLSKCEVARETITVHVPPTGVAPKADVYLLADTTGSMTDVISAVQAGATAIMTNPALAGFDVAWGVGNYRDFPVPPNSYAFAHQQVPTTVQADAQNAIDTWQADQGGDTPEGQLYALHVLATDPAVGWRPDSRRIVVWFGDQPAHDPVCAGLTGLGADLTEAGVTAELGAATITVVAASTNLDAAAGLNGDPTVDNSDYPCAQSGSPGQGTRITVATGGDYVAGVDPTTIVSTLSDLIEAAVTSTGNVHLTPTGDTAEFVESITPSGGYGPLEGDEAHDLTFEVVWRGTKACSEKPQVHTGTIDVVADGVVVAAKPVTVTVPQCRYHHSLQLIAGRVEEGRYDLPTVEPGHYATVVTIYNPTTCPITIEKRFAPLIRGGEDLGREPDQVPAKTFAQIVLQPGHATFDDAVALKEFADGGDLLLGVLDLVAGAPLDVVVTMTTGGRGEGSAPGITSRPVSARRAP